MLAVMMPSCKVNRNVLDSLSLSVHRNLYCTTLGLRCSPSASSVCPLTKLTSSCVFHATHDIRPRRSRTIARRKTSWHTCLLKTALRHYRAQEALPHAHTSGRLIHPWPMFGQVARFSAPLHPPRVSLLGHSHRCRTTAQLDLSTWPRPSQEGPPEPAPSTPQSCRSQRPP